MEVAVTAVGVLCAAGADPQSLLERMERNETALRSHGPLVSLPGGDLAGVVDRLDLDRVLLRKKDKKLLARPSALALAAAGSLVAQWPGERGELGLFLGVGREPPDDGESEGTLAGAARSGELDEELLAGPGRDLYPPLLPLKTLPNMALAHISINLGLMGENGAWAGFEGAGLMALRAGIRAVAEGRSPAVLAGAAESQVDLGSARDRLRAGASGPPGEAAALLLLEPMQVALSRGVRILGTLSACPAEARSSHSELSAILGDCGAANSVLRVIVALLRGETIVVAASDPGLPAVAVAVRPGLPC
jgi:3-oxoacyl-(acyl-carrier-protein) synthase